MLLGDQKYTIDKARGCLVGLALGDDNGGPTAMMLKNLETMTRVRTIMPQYFGKGYLEWFKEDGFDAGLVTHKVLELVDSGLSFDDAAKQVDEELDGMTAGISPAHRSIPLTLYFVAWYLKSPNFFEEFPNTGFQEFEFLIWQEAQLTHLHKEASQVSQAVNAICMYLILGKDDFKSIQFGMKFLSYDWAWHDNIFKHIDSLTIDDLSDGGYAPDVLVAALWFLLNTRSFKDALEQSKEFAGVANYCPVLVGSIGGAMYGYDEIKTQVKSINKDKLKTIESSIGLIIK
jgi:ADP-ribosylglycohydrolase